MKVKHDELTEDLADWVLTRTLGSTSPEEEADWRHHLSVCGVCRTEAGQIEEALATLAVALPKTDPSPELKERLLERVLQADGGPAPLPAAARLMDFEALSWEPADVEGVSFHWLRRDPDDGTLVALARLREGCGFPRHSHRGGEDCFILQGGFREGGREYHAGQLVYYGPGSEHGDFEVTQGPDCILLVVSHGGVGPPLNAEGAN